MNSLNNNIAAAVNAALLSSNFSEYDGDGGRTNRLLTGVLLYKYLENAVQVDSSQLGKINSLAIEYLGNYRQEVEEMRFLYASYFVIRKRFELWGTEIFYDLSSAELEEVYTLYKDKSPKEEFSINSYSDSMYLLTSISRSQSTRMEAIHFKIMVPILKHYQRKYDAGSGIYMNIYDALKVSLNPGKKIEFDIANIPNANVIYDMFKKDLAGVKKYIYNMELYNGHVLLTTI